MADKHLTTDELIRWHAQLAERAADLRRGL
jgi:hypothetical protein